MEEQVSVKELGSYLNSVFNSDIFKKVLASSNNILASSDSFQELGNYLSKYYISTLDNSEESIQYLCSAFVECYEKKINFVENVFLPCIYKIIKEEFNLSDTVRDKLYIAYIIKKRNSSKFYTHCFPGVLYDEVKESGLDISKELFSGELSVLEKVSKTSYKKGLLCYCELSAASLSYATAGMPERVRFALDIKEDKEDIQPKREHFVKLFKKGLDSKIEKGEISKEVASSMFDAGLKIIDYYCSSRESCVAIFKEGKEYDYSFEEYVNKFFNLYLHDIKDVSIVKELNKRINGIKEPIKIVEVLDDFLIEYKDSPFIDLIKLLVDEKVDEIVTHLAIANLEHGGMADGYEIPDGKMASRKMSIVKFETPREVFVDYKDKDREIPHVEVNVRKSYKDIVKDYKTIDKMLLGATSVEGVTKIEVLSNEVLKSGLVAYTVGDKFILPDKYLVEEKDNEYVYSIYNKKILENKIKNMMRDKYFKSDKQLIETIIGKFKNTDGYSEDNYELKEDLEYDALDWYTNEVYNCIEEDKKEKLIKDMGKQQGVFTIKKVDNKYIMIKDGREYELKSNILVDLDGDYPYNDYYRELLSMKEGLKK